MNRHFKYGMTHTVLGCSYGDNFLMLVSVTILNERQTANSVNAKVIVPSLPSNENSSGQSDIFESVNIVKLDSHCADNTYG